MSRPRRRAGDLADLTVLRYVPVDSPVHRLGAAPKIIGLTAMTVALTARASWWAVAVVAGLALLGLVVARIPPGAAPRPPRLLWIGIGLSAGLAVVAGGEPDVTLVGVTVGLGGLAVFARFLAVTILVLAMAGLIGWTTPAADLTPAVAWMLGSLRRLRVPVDELVTALALAVRTLPLLLDELRTLVAVTRTRPPERDARQRWGDAAATAVVASVRRAEELGATLTARGGLAAPTEPLRWRFTDRLVSVVLVAYAMAVIVLA